MCSYIKSWLVVMSLLFGTSNFAAEKDGSMLVDEILETDKVSGKTDAAQVEAVVSSVSKENEMIFERVIGIGSNCLTKAQINQYFVPGSPNRETKKGQADLFDWMRVCDYYSFARSLSNGLSDFFEIEDFTSHYETYGSPKVVDHKTMFWNHKHNTIWRHLFDSEESQKLWSAVRDGEMTPEKLKEVFTPIRGKLDYLKKKFIAAKDKKTLYIISHYEMDGENPPDLGAITCVRDALVQIREGDGQFVLLFLPQEKKFDSFENIIVREAKNLKSGWDGGDSARWKQILDEFKFIPGIWS